MVPTGYCWPSTCQPWLWDTFYVSSPVQKLTWRRWYSDDDFTNEKLRPGGERPRRGHTLAELTGGGARGWLQRPGAEMEAGDRTHQPPLSAPTLSHGACCRPCPRKEPSSPSRCWLKGHFHGLLTTAGVRRPGALRSPLCPAARHHLPCCSDLPQRPWQ